MTEPEAGRRHSFLNVVMIVVGAALVISPSYIVGLLLSHGRLSISVAALASLVMFLVGAFILIRFLRE